MSEEHEVPARPMLRRKKLSPEHLEKLRAGREARQAERRAKFGEQRARLKERVAARQEAEAAPQQDGGLPPNPYGYSKPADPGVDYDAALGGLSANTEFARILGSALAAGISNAMPAPTQFGPKPIPPALAAKRNKARNDLFELLDQYEQNGERPQYEIITPAPGGFFIDDVLIPTGEVITYRGVPNEGMRPLNRTAQAAMDLFLESIGGGTPDLATQSYEAYLNRPRHAEIQGRPVEAPIMGTPRTLRNASVEVVERPAGRYVGPNRIMGTVQPETPGQF